MCSKPVSFLFWSQLANSHCNIALEKEENPKQQNLYAHYLLTKRIDPMIVVKNSIICTFSRFHKHKKHFFYFIADHRILFRMHNITITMLHGFDAKNKRYTL